jgi:glutamate N-acetyltransferase/amino-acid N-acetyltransferase
VSSTAATGDTGPFFRSRWVKAPPHVVDLGLEAGLAAGFRAAGVSCGIKRDGALDLGLLVCDSPQATSAARFCDSGALAAPVLLCQERCRLDGLRTVVANSGNANAATGGAGLDQAARMQGAAAMVTRVGEEFVAVASTGVIGVQLPRDNTIAGIRDASSELRADGEVDFTRAIMTTDAFEKRAALELRLAGGSVRLTAQCKGAGMISPRFATMLCFVQTDAVLAPETADLLLGVCVKRSFDRVSVDGQLSTNDTVILMASGASGVAVGPETEEELRFGEALDALLRQLALMMVADGEGAGRIGRVVVRGGHPEGVEAAARAVANSPLVKSALHGGDPNWGRIVQAVGAALPGSAPLPIDVEVEGVQVCSAGTAVPFDEKALAAAVQGPEVEYVVGLPGEGDETEVFFSDLSHGYVTINAEYTT